MEHVACGGWSLPAASREPVGQKDGPRLFPAEKGRGHGATPARWACGLCRGVRTPEPALGAPWVRGHFSTRPVTRSACTQEAGGAAGAGEAAACAPCVGLRPVPRFRRPIQVEVGLPGSRRLEQVTQGQE